MFQSKLVIYLFALQNQQYITISTYIHVHNITVLHTYLRSYIFTYTYTHIHLHITRIPTYLYYYTIIYIYIYIYILHTYINLHITYISLCTYIYNCSLVKYATHIHAHIIQCVPKDTRTPVSKPGVNNLQLSPPIRYQKLC